MHIIPDFQSEIRLLARDNSYFTFTTQQEAADFARQRGWFSYNISKLGDHFGQTKPVRNAHGIILRYEAQAPHYIARTAQGEIISAEALETLAFSYKAQQPWMRYFNRRHVFREGPVEGIHRSGKYRYFRHPKTKKDLAHQAAENSELRTMYLNGKVGRTRIIVDAWDDIGRSRQRSWKNYRKNQWRT